MVNRKSKAKITPVEMWEMYVQGYSLNEIGGEAGVSGDMVRKLIQNYPQYSQVKLERKLNKYSTGDIKDLVLQGKSKKEIGEILGLTKQQLVVAFKLDTELDQIYKSDQNPKNLQRIKDREQMYQLHQQGLTFVQIAEQMGKSPGYICDNLPQHPKYKSKAQQIEETGTVIRFLKLSGYSVGAISDMMGLIPKTVRKYLKN